MKKGQNAISEIRQSLIPRNRRPSKHKVIAAQASQSIQAKLQAMHRDLPILGVLHNHRCPLQGAKLVRNYIDLALGAPHGANPVPTILFRALRILATMRRFAPLTTRLE